MSFDHCAGRQIRKRLGFQPEATIVSARSSTTAYGVSSYGPSHVSVSRMYSTCVSEWRVPLMKVTPETIGHVAVRADDLLRADPVQDRDDRRIREAALERLQRPRSSPEAFVAMIATSNAGSAAGSSVAVTVRQVLGLPAHPKAVLVQRVRVFAASREHRDLAHAGEMTREETPDDARPDDADPFHAAPRVSQRGDMSVNGFRRSRFRRSGIVIAKSLKRPLSRPVALRTVARMRRLRLCPRFA